ncbi:35141_t:CDS:2, partial [Gigaspora margarita]
LGIRRTRISEIGTSQRDTLDLESIYGTILTLFCGTLENEKVSTVESSDWKLLYSYFHKTLIDLTEKEFAVKNELESATNDKESAETNAEENKTRTDIGIKRFLIPRV